MGKVPVSLGCVIATLCVVGCEPPAARVGPRRAALEARTLLAWDDAVGRILGDEASSEGPMSFALVPDGGALVLDQVNQRVLELDERWRVTGALELPSTTFEDVELFEGAAVLTLDRLSAGVLRVMDRQGGLTAEVPVEGRGIERGGAITAVLPRPDGVWLEVDRRYSVRVLDRSLRPCTRQIVLGRPIGNGRSLRAALDGDGGARISIGRRTEREAEVSVSLVGDAPIVRIPFVGVDAAGDVHVVLHEVRRSPDPPFAVERERYLRVLLDGQLVEVARTESARVRTELDQLVEFRLRPDGRLVQMALTPEGVQLLDWGRGRP